MQPKRAALRIHTATIRGEMLLDGQRIDFRATINYPRVDAEFELADRDCSGRELDQWLALRALETFIDENLRGNAK